PLTHRGNPIVDNARAVTQKRVEPLLNCIERQLVVWGNPQLERRRTGGPAGGRQGDRDDQAFQGHRGALYSTATWLRGNADRERGGVPRADTAGEGRQFRRDAVG